MHVFDDDVGGVIIEETNGITATAEMRGADKVRLADTSLYEDEYFVRLTKEPTDAVEIHLHSIPVRADKHSTSNRQQVSTFPQVLTFDSTNWDQKVKVSVTAIDDGKYYLCKLDACFTPCAHSPNFCGP